MTFVVGMALVLGPGCMTTPPEIPPTPQETVAPEPTNATEPHAPETPLVYNATNQATLPAIIFEACDGTFLRAEVPEEMVRPFIPPQFGSEDVLPPLIQVGLQVATCKRVVRPDGVESNVTVLATLAEVKVTDSSLREESGHGSFFVFELFVTNAAVLEALDGSGLPVQLANASFETAVLREGVVSEHWVVSTKKASFEIDFHHASQQQPLNLSTLRWHFWSVHPDSIARTDIYAHPRAYYSFGTDDVAIVVAAGETTLAKIFPASPIPFASGNRVDASWEVAVEPTLFPNEQG